MEPFVIDITSYEILMLSYISYAVLMWGISHAIKFIRNGS